MTLKTKLITMLLIGSSSVAVANPMVTDYRVSAHVDFGASAPVRDHRGSYYEDRGFYRQQELRFANHDRPHASALPLAVGLKYERSQYRKDIDMTSQNAMRGLLVEGMRGQTYLMKIVIEFANGEIQQVPLNTTLYAGQSFRVDLDGRFRKMQRILVYRADGYEALTMNSP